MLLTRDLDMISASITVTATARGIDDEYKTKFTEPVNATIDLTSSLKSLLDDFYRNIAEPQRKHS